MAKANSVEASQTAIPEKFRSTMKLSEDGNTVFHTVATPRYIRHQIQKNRSAENGLPETWIEVDTAKLAGPGIGQECFTYGLYRLLYDGFQVSKVEDDSPEGIVAAALEYAEIRRDWLYGERIKQTKASSVPKVVRKATEILVETICSAIRDENGKRYTRKTLPDFVKASKTLDEVRSAAEQFGIGKKSTAKILAAAEAACPSLEDLSL